MAETTWQIRKVGNHVVQLHPTIPNTVVYNEDGDALFDIRGEWNDDKALEEVIDLYITAHERGRLLGLFEAKNEIRKALGV